MTHPENTTDYREFADAAAWEAWLSGHHESDAVPGAWLRIAKKGSPLVSVTAARADGRWDAAYTAQRDAPVPPDLAAHPAAAAHFEKLSKTGRYRLVLPLLKARTPAGRATRLDRALAELLEPDG